jgi:pilus assembly protein CpaB
MALVAGAGSAGLLKWYLDKRQAAAPVLSQIVVAAMDLPLATTLKLEHLELVDWPQNARPPGTFIDPKAVVGRVLMSRLVRAEPVLSSKLAAREAGSGLAALVPKDMRAASVRVDDVVGVAGFIHPEDRVDVIVTIRPQQGQAEPESKVILQNVKVLAVGKQIEVEDKNRGKALPVTVATLLVTPEQSERLALAATQGKLLLTLRSWTDEDEVATAGVVAADLLDGKRALAEAPKAKNDGKTVRRTRPAEKVAQAPAPVQKDTVEILRGDRFEERKFDGRKEAP